MQDASYELVWTKNYQILMYKNGQERSFETLSGGQQAAAAMAIRLSLLQQISTIRFAFFDEPTAHLDRERRHQLALQIGAIQSFDQLFVITHDESFAGQANHQITVTAN
jgi:exonuclease SbcC